MLLLKRMKPIAEKKSDPNTLIRLGKNPSTIDKEEPTYSAIFVDVPQGFDNVVYAEQKLSRMLSKQHVHILKSHFGGMIFRVKQHDPYSRMKEIKTCIPKRGCFSCTLFILFKRRNSSFRPLYCHLNYRKTPSQKQ